MGKVGGTIGVLPKVAVGTGAGGAIGERAKVIVGGGGATGEGVMAGGAIGVSVTIPGGRPVDVTVGGTIGVNVVVGPAAGFGVGGATGDPCVGPSDLGTLQLVIVSSKAAAHKTILGFLDNRRMASSLQRIDPEFQFP